MMQFAEREIVALTEDIWLEILGLPTHPVDGCAAGYLKGRTFDGIINITGDWQGAVAVQVPKPLASRVAQILFGLGDEAPSLEDMQDALGEITNMTGGNIKALMPGECHLSLPAVVEGADYTVRIPGTTIITRVVFDCGGAPAVVSLLGARAPHVAYVSGSE
jgi:CheY-specific phosphatase CheX